MSVFTNGQPNRSNNRRSDLYIFKKYERFFSNLEVERDKMHNYKLGKVLLILSLKIKKS